MQSIQKRTNFNMICKTNSNSTFSREGQYVVALYLEKAVVSGFVTKSRVRYGGKVQHTVVTDRAVQFLNEVRPAGTTFLVEEEKLVLAKGTDRK